MLAQLQHVLVDCCTADDPVAALATAKQQHPELQPWLRHIEADGLTLTALLVKKLRFERILRGDAELEQRFHEKPQEFTLTFRRYLAAVPPTAIFPQAEAAAFRAFLEDEAAD